jgi:catechol 2,3-dioxygenase-like lactoylglutathione lyase family enzyme
MSPRPRILRVGLVTAAPEGLAAFYERGLGFARGAIGATDGARSLRLSLGAQEIELLAFAEPGRPYPPGIDGNDPRFQHLAVVVRDMRTAFARLSAESGWTPITRGEPQRLPERSGGVTAFKFRDPDGHPLELLEFPADRTPARWQAPRTAAPCLGIDHSAISVAATRRSIAFYAALGFSVVGQSLNHGSEQERLDGLTGAVAEVTALANPAAPPPHLELLGYRAPPARPAPRPGRNDIAATRLVIEIDDLPLARGLQGAAAERMGNGTLLVQDPDGHALWLRTAAN